MATALQRFQAGRSERSGSRNSDDDHAVRELREELEEIQEENSKLRDVEAQFWLLLNEKEDIKRELETLRDSTKQQQHLQKGGSGASSNSSAKSLASGTITGNLAQLTAGGKGLSLSAQEGLIAQLREENDALSCAVKECMELLLSREARRSGIVVTRGPVSAFLSWLELGQERAEALQTLASAKDEAGLAGHLTPRASKSTRAFSPGYIGGISNEEKEALLTEVHTLKREMRQLQEELDRTDMSRMQALEDSERLQQQLEVVLSNVAELKTAYSSVKAQAEASVRNAQVVQAQKVQLANKDAQIHELKATVTQLRRLADVGGAELAVDAARIRQELARRSSQSTSTAASSQSPQALDVEPM